MDVVYISLCAFGGGIIAAVLGWIDSKEPFDSKKFMSSVIRALVAGFVFGIGYALTGHPVARDFIIAFISGAGVDAIGNRLKIPGSGS